MKRDKRKKHDQGSMHAENISPFSVLCLPMGGTRSIGAEIGTCLLLMLLDK
jgi:hypothetical protein